VESVLIAAARKLDRLDADAWQVGVQVSFFDSIVPF